MLKIWCFLNHISHFSNSFILSIHIPHSSFFQSFFFFFFIAGGSSFFFFLFCWHFTAIKSFSANVLNNIETRKDLKNTYFRLTTQQITHINTFFFLTVVCIFFFIRFKDQQRQNNRTEKKKKKKQCINKLSA